MKANVAVYINIKNSNALKDVTFDVTPETW